MSTQVAEVLGHGAKGVLLVRKWRANSKSWTGVVTVLPGQIVREAHDSELREIKR